MNENCLHSKKICRFDGNYGINDKIISVFMIWRFGGKYGINGKIISVFDLILLRLKKMFFEKISYVSLV